MTADRPVTFEAKLLAPAGWEASPESRPLKLKAEAGGEISLKAQAPAAADGVRRLLTAEISVDGQSHGPITEALVTVKEPEDPKV